MNAPQQGFKERADAELKNAVLKIAIDRTTGNYLDFGVPATVVATTPTAVSAAGTDRSMWPRRITSVAPAAMTPR